MRLTLPAFCAIVMKSGNLNFLGLSGPLQACNGTALPFLHTCIHMYIHTYICMYVPMYACMYVCIYVLCKPAYVLCETKDTVTV